MVRLRRLLPLRAPWSGEAADMNCAHHALSRMRHPGSMLDTNMAHLSYSGTAATAVVLSGCFAGC